MISGGNRYSYYADALGSVRLITDAAGSIVESYTYDPYGRPRVSVGLSAAASVPCFAVSSRNPFYNSES